MADEIGDVRDLLALLATGQLQGLVDSLNELAHRIQAVHASSDVRPSTEAARPTARGRRSQKRGVRNLDRQNSIALAINQLPKIERAELPAPPAHPYGDLPIPAGAHEWDALQGPVNLACQHLKSAQAQAAWKQRALSQDVLRVAVALAWWTAAHFFNPGHPHAPLTKEHAFRVFSHAYTTRVLTVTGAGADRFQRLWQTVVAAAAVNVLRNAFPGSEAELGPSLERALLAHVVRWCAGVLPADAHPSQLALVGQPSSPAAHTLHERHLARSRRASNTPGSPTAQDRGTAHHADETKAARAAPPRLAAVVSGATRGPSDIAGTAAVLQAPLNAAAVHSHEGSRAALRSPRIATGAVFQPQQCSPAVAHLFEAHGLGRARQQDAAPPGVLAHTLGAGQLSRRRALSALPGPPMLLAGQHVDGNEKHGIRAHASVSAPAGPGNGKAIESGLDFTYGALAQESCARAADAVARYEACKATARKEVAQARAQWRQQRDLLQAVTADVTTGVTTKALSDRLSHWIESDVDRLLRDQPPAAIPAHVKTRGVGMPRRGPRRVLGAELRITGDAPPQWGTALSATDAVLVAKGGASAGAAALTATGGDVGGSGRPPGYQAMTAATVAGAGCASASFLAHKAAAAVGGRNAGASLTRIMQPWSKMRAVEGRIRGALSQAEHGGSGDIAARGAAWEARVTERLRHPGMPGNGLVGRQWRPMALDKADCARGTQDIRLRRHVQAALRQVSLDLYH